METRGATTSPLAAAASPRVNPPLELFFGYFFMLSSLSLSMNPSAIYSQSRVIHLTEHSFGKMLKHKKHDLRGDLKTFLQNSDQATVGSRGLACFGFGTFHVIRLHGPRIWVSDPYELIEKVQPVSPAWGAEGFEAFVLEGIDSHHIVASTLGILIAFIVVGIMWTKLIIEQSKLWRVYLKLFLE
ncbi:hypothetical protein ZIOFF_033452 [Zingiber officinale]|uniref:Uncharacterized protein n=1 Tax=Zingiber officinale TaxID=94328 RepID=A0A8J5GX27_ZINOF|nr:hypothetical protein ZIOFF_033452 [Zingiber officinale]